MIELPELDSSRCTGCGDCVVACPTRCLALVGPSPQLVRPRDCIACAMCVNVCPEDALRMVEEERLTTDHTDRHG